MASSSRLASTISFLASVLHFLLLIFQIPLFRVPCGSGTCMSPVAVTSYQLIATATLPPAFAKALLYPGAAADAVIKGTTIPIHSQLLDVYHLRNTKAAPAATPDIQHLEIVAGSYLAVFGAFLGLRRRGRISLLGVLLLLWGLVKEPTSTRHNAKSTEMTMILKVQPTMLIALLLALCSVESDVRKIIRCRRTKHFTRIRKSVLKSKCM